MANVVLHFFFLKKKHHLNSVFIVFFVVFIVVAVVVVVYWGRWSHTCMYENAYLFVRLVAFLFFSSPTDKERPRVSFCPSDIKRQSENAVRVTWNYPTFEDNFDKPPVQLHITSNRNPGVEFPWGIYPVIYEASDRAGNKAKCEFNVEVGRKFHPQRT